MNKTLIIQSNLLIDTKKPDGAKYSTLSHRVILRTHVGYTRIATARLGVQHQGILQFQSFNPKRDLTQIVTTSLPATGRRVGGYQTMTSPNSSCGQSGFNERSTNCSTGIYLPPKASPTQQFPVFD